MSLRWVFMLSWFRERCRAVASVALVSLVTLTISSAAPHADDCHGAECSSVTLHDASAHRIGRPADTNDHAEHCVVCHWTRTIRPAPETTHPLAPVDAENARIVLDASAAVSETALARPSLRAPPVSPGLA